MGDIGAIHEDVPFDFGGAAALAAEFRSMASVLDDQAGQRPGIADGAKAEWRGAYRLKFDQRVSVCTGDGGALAGACRTAADGLDTLAAAARREQRRREWAREWARQHEDRNLLEKGLDNIGDFFGGGDSDIPPPPPPELQEHVSTPAVVSAAR